MLAEGIHGDIDGVIMLRNTISPNMYFQMIGRAFSCGKKTIPLIIDLVANSQFISETADNFPNELRGEIERRKEECKKEGKEYDPGFDVDDFIIMDQFMDVVSGFKAIEERLQGSWDLYIKALKQYKEREGDCLVPQKHNEILENGIRVPLGNWVSNMRNTKNGEGKSLLTAERIKQLDELNFIWDELKYRFEINVNACIKFFEKYGRKPNKNSDNEYEKKLGIFWCLNRNKQNLPQWKVNLLLQIPSFFKKEDISTYEKFYKRALIYKEKYGNLDFKKDDQINGRNIYRLYNSLKSKRSKLTKEQIEKLKDIGVDLNIDKVRENYNRKMELAKQAVNEGVIISCQNKFYEGVNFYNFKNIHMKSFTNEEREIMNKLVPNPGCMKPVNVIDVKNEQIYMYPSIKDAGRALYSNFHIVGSDKAGLSAIIKRLRGETKNPFYKGFRFEYADDEVSLRDDKIS